MSSRISILWGLGEINQALVTWQCEWNRERKFWQAKMEFMGAAGTHIPLWLTSSWQIYISKLVVNCHGWGANASFLCVCHAFSTAVIWGRGAGKDHTSIPSAAPTLQPAVAGNHSSWQPPYPFTKLYFGQLSTTPLECSLQNLVINLEKEGETFSAGRYSKLRKQL